MEVFNKLNKGEIFRIVTTRVQNVYDPMGTMLTFACIKGRGDVNDWAIYAGLPDKPIHTIAHLGDKVFTETEIKDLCPCDDNVYQLYRM